VSSLKTNPSLRNIAVIAHVDHGKTTLVDQLLRQSGLFRENQQIAERVMDNMDLERERGITIAAKNCSIYWKDVRINILDTPGHADFGGEVERSLKMVDGVILLVDAAEGPLPQTRFVLKKALESGLAVLVIINKTDRKDARPKEVLDKIYELFLDLGANDKQIEFPVFYAVGREGTCRTVLEETGKDLQPLFDAILEHVPAPSYDPSEPFQMLVCDLDYSDYLGRLAIGRVFNGSVRKNEELSRVDSDGKILPFKVSQIQTYDGLNLKETDEAQPGDIIILAGVEEAGIGDTICNRIAPKALPRLVVDEPTLSMMFTVNTSPFSGREGEYVQTRKLAERLRRETLMNVAIQVEGTENADKFIVKGRGEFQMEILIETMRREGFELCVGRPNVIFKEKDGKTLEPVEHLVVDCEEGSIGIITEKLSSRRGVMEKLENQGNGRVIMEFNVPSRALLGYRSEFLTDTRGTGVISSYLKGYEPYRGDIADRTNGSLVADRQGPAMAYAIHHLEERGNLFVAPGDPIYEGMVVGETNRDKDLVVNVCKEKKMTNMRSSTKDFAVFLRPIAPMTLGRAIMTIKTDELVEVTPKSIRLRKALLSAVDRKRARPDIQEEEDSDD
jgi:GTP-binding protein